MNSIPNKVRHDSILGKRNSTPKGVRVEKYSRSEEWFYEAEDASRECLLIG